MESMGLWRPSPDPLRLQQKDISSCIFYFCLDSFSFGCLNVGVCLSCSQGFSLNCSLFRARLCGGGGGGSVTIEGFVLYAGEDYGLYLYIMLLVQVMAYVMSGTFAIDIVGH